VISTGVYQQMEAVTEASIFLTVLNRDLATVELPIRSVPQMPPKVCDFWLQFPRFVPNPTASFVEEFDSLARHMAWSAKNRRKNLVKALAAEIDFHCDGSSGLIRWQRLCQEVGVGSKPASITQCKQVSPKTLLKRPVTADTA
jgi:hypothetical protein